MIMIADDATLLTAPPTAAATIDCAAFAPSALVTPAVNTLPTPNPTAPPIAPIPTLIPTSARFSRPNSRRVPFANPTTCAATFNPPMITAPIRISLINCRTITGIAALIAAHT
ncbi:hypothetical protein ACFU5C_36640, partial [Streptomyces sp. NPDC057426]